VGRIPLTLALLVLATAGLQTQAPLEVRQWATAAGMTAPIAAWCQGQIRPGQQGYAVAAGGRYLVLDGRGAVAELAAFKGKPDLSCYSRAAALELHRDIQRSETLSGTIAPRFATAVICGFVEATTATCWQYSPAERAYVEVGGWRT
jgi:hypothetical protein